MKYENYFGFGPGFKSGYYTNYLNNIMKLRILADVHGQRQTYLDTIKNCDYSIQLGDLDFNYDWLPEMPNHRHILGNHDGYNQPKHPNNLGDFGKVDFLPVDLNMFFIRGAWSIDWKYRTPNFDWFEKEELTSEQLDKAYKEYCNVKPSIMLSHEAPYSILDHLNLSRLFALNYGYTTNCISTRTNIALQKMFDEHKPKIYFFGHYHKDFDKIIDGTRFICLTTDINIPCKQRYWDLEI